MRKRGSLLGVATVVAMVLALGLSAPGHAVVQVDPQGGPQSLIVNPSNGGDSQLYLTLPDVKDNKVLATVSRGRRPWKRGRP